MYIYIYPNNGFPFQPVPSKPSPISSFTHFPACFTYSKEMSANTSVQWLEHKQPTT